MRDVRRLPPLFRAVSTLSWLFPLASIGIFVALLIMTSRLPVLQWSADTYRAGIAALNLITIGGACDLPVRAYKMRVRLPGDAAPRLNTWRSHMQVFLLVATPPLCALALAATLPSTTLAAAGIAGISIAGAIIMVQAHRLVCSEMQSGV